jgi:hypothetical protein
MLILLVPGAAVSSLVRLLPDADEAPTKAKAESAKSDKICQSALSVRALQRLPKGNIIAPFDMGPTILAQTEHSVVASSHHRNEQAMHDHIQIFRSNTATALAMMKARDIDYIVVCAEGTELDYYLRKDPQGLWAHLANGKTPAGLERMADRGSGIRVWRVR